MVVLCELYILHWNKFLNVTIVKIFSHIVPNVRSIALTNVVDRVVIFSPDGIELTNCHREFNRTGDK